MANEIYVNYPSGNTLYAIIRTPAGLVWYAVGGLFETWGTDSRAIADYAVSMSDKSGSYYTAGLDMNIDAGGLIVQMRLQDGAAPSDSDEIIFSKEIFWSGTGRITAEKLLANKAVQNKIDGQIIYYDDDEQNILLRHMPEDTEQSITRQPI